MPEYVVLVYARGQKWLSTALWAETVGLSTAIKPTERPPSGLWKCLLRAKGVVAIRAIGAL